MATFLLPEKIDLRATLLQFERDRCEQDLAYFIRKAWPIVEPAVEYVEGWHIKLICMHLEAITNDEEIDGKPYNRLLINVPPGMMKSLLVNVLWPAWEWGPKNHPNYRYLLVSHTVKLSIRDTTKLRRLISSEWYQERWPIKLRDDQDAKLKFENVTTGFVEVAAAGSITGQRGDRVLLDDAMSFEDANSEVVRASRKEWFLGALPTRMNSPIKSAIVVIEQRLHQEDVSGLILDGQLGYDHIRLPMRYDPGFPMPPTMLGVTDPRTKQGELLFPERFPASVVDRLELTMGAYNVAGQHQQEPVPKGGGIIKRDWWKVWDDDKYPDLDYILAVVDTAYGEKQENDYSAMTVFGVFTVSNKAQAVTKVISRFGNTHQIERAYAEAAPNVILMYAWHAKLPFHELAKRVLDTCRKYKIDRLIVEDKAAGISVLQELRRVVSVEEFGLEAITPTGGDKWTRANAVSYLWQEGIVWAPNKEWAEMTILECEIFPKGKNDDLVDCCVHGIKYLRDNGLLSRAPERLVEIRDALAWGSHKKFQPLYPA